VVRGHSSQLSCWTFPAQSRRSSLRRIAAVHPVIATIRQDCKIHKKGCTHASGQSCHYVSRLFGRYRCISETSRKRENPNKIRRREYSGLSKAVRCEQWVSRRLHHRIAVGIACSMDQKSPPQNTSVDGMGTEVLFIFSDGTLGKAAVPRSPCYSQKSPFSGSAP
jgi:hypothetical protein